MPFDTYGDDGPSAQLQAEIEAAKHQLQAEIEAAQQHCKKVMSKASKKAATTTRKKPKKDQRAEIRALFYDTEENERDHGHRGQGTSGDEILPIED